MGWLLFEVLLAVAVLVGMVWWTMFSGRPNGERQPLGGNKNDQGDDQAR